MHRRVVGNIDLVEVVHELGEGLTPTDCWLRILVHLDITPSVQC